MPLATMWQPSINIHGAVKMWPETSQYNIPSRQLLATNGQPGAYRWTEIGEPKITYTISGRAMVRQISEQGKSYRTWLLAALAVAAIAIAAWQGWVESQQAEQLQSATPPTPPGARVRITAPAIQSEYITPPATPPLEMSNPITPSQSKINNPATSRETALQQPPGLKASMQMDANPVADQSLKTSRPQVASPATTSSSSKKQTEKQPRLKLLAPIQPVAPIAATQPAAQPGPDEPAATTTFADPMLKESAPAPSPAGEN